MATYVEIRMPRYPECWDVCGSCAAGDVVVVQVLVQPGDQLERYQSIIVVDSGKTALDIPTDKAGRVVEIKVQAGDKVGEGALVLILDVGKTPD